MTIDLRSSRRISSIYLVIAVAVFAVNLRPALVAVGPLTEQLRADTGLSATAVSLLTTVPLLCFAAFSTLAPRLARRVGLERALVASAALLLVGFGARLLPSMPALYVGAAIIGIGIALGNVLVPVVIKRDFATRIGPMMALYSVMLNLGAAAAAAISVPLGHSFSWGWRPTLALWAVPAFVALMLWLPLAVRGRASAPTAVSGAQIVRVWRSRTAWAVAAFLGLQSMIFYAFTAWLPTMLQDAGLSESAAGVMTGVLSGSGIAGALVVPVLAARAADQRRHAVACSTIIALGIVGLLVAPANGTLIWTVLLGLGCGGSISLALTFFALRSRTAAGAGALAGMAQSVGYGMAAVGPILAGALHDIGHGWTLPLIALLVIIAIQGFIGLFAGADKNVEP